MQDMTFRPSVEKRRSTRRISLTLAVALVLAGLSAGAWLSWRHGWFHVDVVAQPAPTGAPASTAASTSATIVAQGNLIATNAALADATARLTALQQRLAELDQQAAAASGQATRAEALLVALTVRRAIERGQPLGMLETPLRQRFGTSQPAAVDQIIAAGAKPVTLGALTEEFASIAPHLTGGPANEGTWDWLTRQIGGMFIIRHDDMPSPAPESRIARARMALTGGRVDLAVAEIERLPGRDAAGEWLAHARDYEASQHALDQIESAALTLPAAPPMPPAPPVAAAKP